MKRVGHWIGGKAVEGGSGRSGPVFGDTHIYGPEGIRFCTRTKVATSRWPDPSTSTVDLGFPRTR